MEYMLGGFIQGRCEELGHGLGVQGFGFKVSGFRVALGVQNMEQWGSYCQKVLRVRFCLIRSYSPP